MGFLEELRFWVRKLADTQVLYSDFQILYQDWLLENSNKLQQVINREGTGYYGCLPINEVFDLFKKQVSAPQAFVTIGLNYNDSFVFDEHVSSPSSFFNYYVVDGRGFYQPYSRPPEIVEAEAGYLRFDSLANTLVAHFNGERWFLVEEDGRDYAGGYSVIFYTVDAKPLIHSHGNLSWWERPDFQGFNHRWFWNDVRGWHHEQRF